MAGTGACPLGGSELAASRSTHAVRFQEVSASALKNSRLSRNCALVAPWFSNAAGAWWNMNLADQEVPAAADVRRIVSTTSILVISDHVVTLNTNIMEYSLSNFYDSREFLVRSLIWSSPRYVLLRYR